MGIWAKWANMKYTARSTELPVSATKEMAFEQLKEVARRGLSDAWLDNELHPNQVALIRDPAIKKSALCSRRSGKTYADSYYLWRTALKFPGCVCLYLTTTRQQAKELMWTALKNVNDDPRHEFVDPSCFKETELNVVLPNKSRIWIRGADKLKEVDKLRGHPYKLVILDEAQMFGDYIYDLIEEVLDPALQEHDGTLLLSGTPSASCVGYFFDATCDRTENRNVYEQYSRHSWSVAENPYFPKWAGKADWQERARQFLEEYRSTRGWDANNPKFLREWCFTWVRTSEDLIYPFSPERNTFDFLPHLDERGWHHVLGVDLGFDDPSAFIDVSWHDNDPHVYVYNGFSKPEMSVSDVAKEIKDRLARRRYSRIVMDTGNLGKMVANEISIRFTIPIEPAPKKDKMEHVALIADDFLTGRLKIRKHDPLIGEVKQLQWNDERTGIHKGYSDHISDAMLYAWRTAFHYHSRPKGPPKKSWAEEYKEKLILGMGCGKPTMGSIPRRTLGE